MLTIRSSVPPTFRKDAKGRIEGFLFPATYEFTPRTTSAQLVDDQIDSGWTMTVAAALLRDAGASGVLPLVLATTTG